MRFININNSLESFLKKIYKKKGRGSKLSSEEVHLALLLKQENWKFLESAKKLRRNVIINLLKDPENYDKKRSSSRPRAISQREERAILRVASNSSLTAKQIAAEVNVKTKVRNVQRIFQKSELIKRKKNQEQAPSFKKAQGG